MKEAIEEIQARGFSHGDTSSEEEQLKYGQMGQMHRIKEVSARREVSAR